MKSRLQAKDYSKFMTGWIYQCHIRLSGLALALFLFSETGLVLAEPLVLRTAEQEIVLDVEIADDSAERSKGLMHVKSLPPNAGMLFDFRRSRLITMWMKNTEISLDMFFVDATGKILYIKEEAVPRSLEIISYDMPARAVLELNGGFARKNFVQVGDMLLHPLFENE